MAEKLFALIAAMLLPGSALLLPHTQAHADEGGSHERIWTLDDTVNAFDPEAAEATKAGSQYWFVDRRQLDGRTLKLSVVAPGKATHAPHKHAEDEFFFLLEGTAEFHLNGESRRVGPYTSLYCPPDSLHGIRNVGDSDLKYLVIKKYLNLGK